MAKKRKKTTRRNKNPIGGAVRRAVSKVKTAVRRRRKNPISFKGFDLMEIAGILSGYLGTDYILNLLNLKYTGVDGATIEQIKKNENGVLNFYIKKKNEEAATPYTFQEAFAQNIIEKSFIGNIIAPAVSGILGLKYGKRLGKIVEPLSKGVLVNAGVELVEYMTRRFTGQNITPSLSGLGNSQPTSISDDVISRMIAETMSKPQNQTQMNGLGSQATFRKVN